MAGPKSIWNRFNRKRGKV